jgi:hypothetical protein
MQYITPDFIKSYENADKIERKRMLHSILALWDSEYRNLISSGITPDTIWNMGIRQTGMIIGTDGADRDYRVN